MLMKTATSLCEFNLLRRILGELNVEELDLQSHLLTQSPDRGKSLQCSVPDHETLKQIKEAMPHEFHQITKLWDAESNDVTYDDDRIAEILCTAAEELVRNT